MAHDLQKMGGDYVVSVKFVKSAAVYITGTTNGEVKIWKSGSCMLMGVLNSPNWNMKSVLKYI